jgi:hypothetical protein
MIREEMEFVTIGNMFQDKTGGVDFGSTPLYRVPTGSRLFLRPRHIKKKHTNYAESRYQ